MSKSYWIYILNCANNSYYTGYTTDLERRFKEHVQGSLKCKYTRAFKAQSIAQAWLVDDKKLALKIERYIKQHSKQNKSNFIAKPALLMAQFPSIKNVHIDKIL